MSPGLGPAASEARTDADWLAQAARLAERARPLSRPNPAVGAIIVKDGVVLAARVLFYKESRGEQVGELSFLQQLLGARAAGSGIDRVPDNIAGATYSVKLMQRMAATALKLDTLAP